VQLSRLIKGQTALGLTFQLPDLIRQRTTRGGRQNAQLSHLRGALKRSWRRKNSIYRNWKRNMKTRKLKGHFRGSQVPNLLLSEERYARRLKKTSSSAWSTMRSRRKRSLMTCRPRSSQNLHSSLRSTRTRDRWSHRQATWLQQKQSKTSRRLHQVERWSSRSCWDIHQLFTQSSMNTPGD
jgi:hypothetical protein